MSLRMLLTALFVGAAVSPGRGSLSGRQPHHASQANTVGPLYRLFHSSLPTCPMSAGKCVCFLRFREKRNVPEFTSTKAALEPVRGEFVELGCGVTAFLEVA